MPGQSGIEQTMSALNDVNAQSKQNLEALVACVTAATRGAEALGAEAMAFAKKTLEEQASAAKALAGAKSPQEAMELQTAFAKSAMEAYVAEMTKITEIVTASVTESMKPFSERVTAMTELAGRIGTQAKKT